jgi:hypothetical protein
MVNIPLLASSGTKGLKTLGDVTGDLSLGKAYDLNAGLLDMSADGVIAAGDRQAENIEEQGAKFVSYQRALYAKSGVTMEGSPMDVLVDTERTIRLDILSTKLNAAQKSNDIRFEALQYRLAAGNQRVKAMQDLNRGILEIGTDVGLSQYGKNKGTVKGTGKTQSQILGFNTREYT